MAISSRFTEANAYRSGNNGRAAIKGNSIYYITGNDNNGGLKVTKTLDQLDGTQVGLNLLGLKRSRIAHSRPGSRPIPPNVAKIGDFEITQVNDPATCTPGGPCTKYVLD